MTAQIIDTMLRFSGRLEELSDDMQRELFDRRANADPEIASATRDIIERVKETGDDALRALAEQFDGVSLANIEVPRSVIREARDSIDDQLREALEHAAANIRKVHEAQLPIESAVEVERGVFVSRRPDPLNRVGAYAPGGTAAYASSVLMTVIPARAAGVDEIILCSPPGKDGMPAREIMAAAAIASVDRLFAVGGAGAIAAMAFGTASIPRVDRIVGPGNAYVAEAKSQLASYVGIDCPAGPSELLIIADSSVSAYVVAREAIAQAEHDTRAVVGIITIGKCKDDILPALRITADSQPRRGIVSEALRTRGFMIQVDTSDEAVRLATRFAPEHLLIVTRDADAIAAGVRGAGAVFVGASSSVAFGDYITGGNHVLPTGGLGRAYSGLSTLDFVRWTSVQRVTKEAAKRLAAPTGVFARAEGLPGHAATAEYWGIAR
jgi:histidinol dehydrogenase